MDTKLEKLGKKEYRLSNLYKVIDKNQKLLTFLPNEAQKHFLENKANRNIILKARQLGFTTLSVIDMLDDVLFTPNMNAMLISYDLPSAEGVFYKLKLAWENFPLRDLYQIDTENKRQYRFGFGNGDVSSIEVKTTGRSGTFNRVHVTELAKIAKDYPQKAEELITGTIPAVPLDGRVDIESTAEGEIGIFYEMFMEAWNNPEIKYPTQYKAHFYNWTWDKENIGKAPSIPVAEMDEKDVFEKYQKEYSLSDQEISYYYIQWLNLNKNWNKLYQEFPTTVEEAFVSSGSLFFDTKNFQNQKPNFITPKIEGKWNIYDEYHPMHVYAIGADPSEGVGRDSATAVIWDMTKMKVVADYANKDIAPDQLAYELKSFGNRYGTCIIGVERNNHGHTTLAKLKEIYPSNRIYTEEKVDKVRNEKTKRLGWLTTSASKPRMLYELKSAFDEELIIIPSQRIMQEVKTYNSDNVSATKSQITRHWDLLMALAIGYQMKNHVRRNSAYVEDKFDRDLMQGSNNRESNRSTRPTQRRYGRTVYQ